VSVAIVYFVILAVAFFFLIVRPQRRRAMAHRNFVATLSVGDEVITSGGIFGTIVAIDEDRVEVQVSPGVVLTVAKQALAQSAFPPPPVTDEPGDDGATGDGPTGATGDDGDDGDEG
jgi:preprotein translocase subunit YajC